MKRDFKKEAEEWAEKVLSESPINQKLDEQLLEFMVLGSLLYKENEKGEMIWVKRLDN